MENALQTFLHMPMPMATALLIMAAIAAFLFVKLLALLLMPVPRSEHLLVIRRPAQPRTQPAADQAMPRVKASAPAKSAVAAGKRRMPRRDEHGKFVSAC
ncbi:MAG: hypothetical protein K1X51_17110 [Rhodospirillaceae bacterium]|nr:hypothetical protein [Rhodospirillaceae bacterium]